MGTHRIWDGILSTPTQDGDPSRLALALDRAGQLAFATPADAPAPLAPRVPDDPAARLGRLEPETAVALAGGEFAGLLSLRLRADLSRPPAEVLVGTDALLTLAPPAVEDLAAAVGFVRQAATEREWRIPEIVAQANGFLPFLGSAADINPSRRRWTRLLLVALHDAVVGIETRVKFHASLPRPQDFDPNLRPIVPTPAHSTWPSGHATEAFAAATAIAALRLAGEGQDPVVALQEGLAGDGLDPVAQALFGAAARIAENRVVAGLHFPVDNASGALLGVATALALVAAMAGQGSALRAWNTEGAPWQGRFDLERWLAWLPGAAPDPEATVPAPGLPEGSVLPFLWKQAVAEWGGTPEVER